MSEQRPPGGKGQPKIQIQLDDAVSQGQYSNLVLINHTENEFILDFAFLLPGVPRARVHSRIISSPQHTKRLYRALKQNLDKYEERFGELEMGDDETPIVH